MEFDLSTKYLILDKSGYDGFTLAFSNGIINNFVFYDFLDRNNITPVITQEAFNAGEFTEHSYAPNLFSGIITSNDYEQDKIVSVNNDGTLTSTWQQNPVQIISASVYSNTKSQEESSGFKITKFGIQQSLLWESSEHWEKISNSSSDVSAVYLSREFAKQDINFSVLVNDWHLREQLRIEGHPIIGSVALLAEMVLTKTISVQRGNFIYYNVWQRMNTKLLPNKNNFTKEKYKFKEVLKIEREKVKNNRSFWA